MAPPDPKARKRTAPRRNGIRVSGGLKSLADTRKYGESLILGPTQKYVLEKEGLDTSRRQDHIHPSEMSHADWCPKATYLRIKGVRAGSAHIKEAFGFQSLSIFQHGHEVHSKWQAWLWGQGILWGRWGCRSCGAEWDATSPQECSFCSSHDIVYREIPLDAEQENLIVGSADGGVLDHAALIEFKSVGTGTLRFEEPELLRAHTHKTVDGKNLIDYEGLWRGITHPFKSHQRQGQIYLWLAKYVGLDLDRVIFIYESKFHQGAKEFVVKRRESIIESVLDSAYDIKKALDDGGSTPTCPRGGCKQCEPEGESHGAESTLRRGAGSEREMGREAPRRKGAGLRRKADGGASRAA